MYKRSQKSNNLTEKKYMCACTNVYIYIYLNIHVHILIAENRRKKLLILSQVNFYTR